MKAIFFYLVALLLLLEQSRCTAFARSITSSLSKSNVPGNGKRKDTVREMKTFSRDRKFTARSSSTDSIGYIARSAPFLVAQKAAPIAATVSVKDAVAKGLGYVLAAGAMTVYTPILLNLVKTKSAKGYSVATWVFNVIGLTMAALYPFKRGYLVTTYVEILMIAIQSVGILGLVCTFQERSREYMIGMGLFLSAVTAIIALPMSSDALNIMQLAAILICNYANLPQILLTFKSGVSSWSWITAAMSMAGNLIRVYTTLALTKDKLVLSGYVLGFVSNAVLFAQCFIYPPATPSPK